MITQQSTLTNTLKPSSRRSRTKLRKPKFLHLHLISAVPPPMPTTTNHHKQLINLFPLHPENINKALDEEDHNMAACIFSSCDDVDGAATTLTGILCSGEQDHYTNHPSPSSSVNYADEEVDLVRTAMRRNNKTERNDNDNDNDNDLKWVCYSEVVKENKKKIKIKKEVMVRGLSASSSSSTSSYHHYNHHHHHHNHHHNGVDDDDDDDHGRKLVLKLDYEKIMNSWVNKGPLYINSNNNNKNPDIQTVPELQEDDFFLPSSTIGLTQCERENGGNEGSWTVPEIAGIENNDNDRGDDILQAVGSNTMIHHREASVQRYKEKRRNRLFAKTIRYEVRKLNAEKRPRIKGRFVKRN